MIGIEYVVTNEGVSRFEWKINCLMSSDDHSIQP